jgi:exodeoxyribonuclease VII large subunit
MDLLEDPNGGPPPSNSPEFTVSELSGAVKRVIEGEFGRVRVRGEISRVSRPASGHLYFDLKDDAAVIAAITWKGQAGRLQVRPEEGIEVIATGRLTTFPGQSKYQLVVETLELAGAGALMAMLEKRRAQFQAEGLFDPARKKPVPYLPEVIGVVTSPSGAVIRDILHRLRDRFPRRVLLWPVAVQGAACAPEVAAAIRGFNALPAGGAIPRPDLLIVARGGGSVEDLWGFNDEAVVRAAAASAIPLISAVGHETDTTLLDFAADLRAPTPTAAAELAVPVRQELLAALADLGARQIRASGLGAARRRDRLRDLARALPRAERLLDGPRQRLDAAAARADGALGLYVTRKRGAFERLAALHRPDALRQGLARRREVLAARRAALDARWERRRDGQAARLDKWASRLDPAFRRLVADARRDLGLGRQRLADLALRADTALAARLTQARAALEALERLRAGLGHETTLKRGFAVVRGDGAVVTTPAAVEAAREVEIEFAAGRVRLGGRRAAPPARKGDEDQGRLF